MTTDMASQPDSIHAARHLNVSGLVTGSLLDPGRSGRLS